MSHAAQFADVTQALTYILAGDARVTLVSKKTGTRFTFEIALKRDKDGAPASPHFVRVLTGPNNTRDYDFLGSVFDRASYRHGRKSKITPDAPSARAFAWVFDRLVKGELPEQVEVWHEGRCGRCGRPLTTPESIASGIGPVCADMGF
jgi:hypothetical protein